MSEKQGKRNWTHEETTLALALALYLCTPTNKIRENNPNVQLLAEAFNRTPTAVNMKLYNLGSHDILLKQKKVHGREPDKKGEGFPAVWLTTKPMKAPTLAGAFT